MLNPMLNHVSRPVASPASLRLRLRSVWHIARPTAAVCAVACAALVSANIPAQAQNVGRATPPTEENKKEAGDYLLAAEDVIAVTVFKHPELSADSLVVTRAGKINLPVAGEITVAGKDLKQVQNEIATRLKKLLLKPQVTVALRQARPQRVFVTGGVTKSNYYEMQPNWRVSEALAAAGGLVGKVEDSTATLSRQGEAPTPLDLAQLMANPASTANPQLQPGDVITVVHDPRKFMVSGEVTRPDTFDVRKAPRLLDALAAAGWLKNKTTASRAFIIRKGQRVDVDLVGAIENKSEAANIALQADDVLMVEKIPATIYVEGLVKSSGPYEFEPGSGVMEVVAQAGGLSEPASKIVASLRRGAQTLPVDLTRVAFDPAANLKVQHNDVLLLKEIQTIRVQISGAVARPGTLQLLPQARLLDAIAEAGGLNIPREDARINILRNENEKQITLKADAVALLSLEDLRQNTKLQDGDFVTVTQPKAETVFITGEVDKPGTYDLKEGEGLAEVIARAGGPTVTAALKTVSVTNREGAAATHDLSAIRNGEKPAIRLQSGDFITVPRRTAQVMVLEAVLKPGPVPIPEDRPLTLGDALGAAGGPRDKARTKEIAIIRQVKGEIQQQIVALSAVYNGVPASQTPLQDGDVVFVSPEKESFLKKLGPLSPFFYLFR